MPSTMFRSRVVGGTSDSACACSDDESCMFPTFLFSGDALTTGRYPAL